ncbi:hypothetical protein L249_6683 [Ophiocordyceps polyrhachis-furcata BCC 54312]|uniref:Reverse transcriptase RNase H-like domain-containing protein n=1 Tax=Ophiocordyceps polyrhachis-furcata BCC 54312 TaxID=1330021 RepID=A0A367LJZ5_9HYPO|nr:hypothetical protein L249_6683 [Ophiocordyceps polyrhachis-furcata BCC 54312]
MLAISSALLALLPRSLDLCNPKDKVAAFRISYKILLDILDMLVNEGDLTTSSKAILSSIRHSRLSLLISLKRYCLRHISGKKNLIANALSRKLTIEIDWIKREKDSDSEDFIDLYLNSI